MKADTWMPFYVSDYLKDTMDLTCMEHGAYMLLLMAAWTRGGILPKRAGALASITKLSLAEWSSVSDAVLPFFTETEDGYRHKRVSEEYEKAQRLSEARRGAGNSGAESRWGRSDGRSRSQRLADARARGTHTDAEWKGLIEVLGRRCVKCGVTSKELLGSALCKDHIIPIYQDGSDAIENIQPFCRECNAGKGNENIDYRKNVCHDWRERLAKRLANAKQTPTPAQVARPSPLQLPSEVSNSVPIGPELERAGATPAQRAMALELIETVRSPEKPKPPKPSRRAPSAWAPSAATMQTLTAEGYQPGQLERELAILRDHEFKTARSDWDACFRNWVRRSAPQNLRVINEQPRYNNRTSDYVSKLQDIGAAMVADCE